MKKEAAQVNLNHAKLVDEMSKDRKLWSSNRPSLLANLYQGELQ